MSLSHSTTGLPDEQKDPITNLPGMHTAQAIEELKLLGRDQKASGSKIYISSNELGTKILLENLKKQTFSAGHCHIGISGLFNWSIASATKPHLMIQLDINPEMVAINKIAIELLKEAENGKQFASKLATYCLAQMTEDEKSIAGSYEHYSTSYDLGGEDADSTLYIAETMNVCNSHAFRNPRSDIRFKELLNKFFNAPGSVFEDISSFLLLKKMATENRIIVLPGDLTNVEQMTTIAAVLKKHDFFVGTLYVSNAGEWVHKNTPSKARDFMQSLDALSNPNTVVIKSLSDPSNTENFIHMKLSAFPFQDKAKYHFYHAGDVKSLAALKPGIFSRSAAVPATPTTSSTSSSSHSNNLNLA